MPDTKTTIAQDLEQLFRKSTEANQVFFSESLKFVKDLSSSKKTSEDILTVPKQLMQDALNMFVKLNIQHASNLVDLGISISKRMNLNGSAVSQEEVTHASPTHHSFSIEVSGEPGDEVTAQFLLDSDKQEPVVCHLKQSEYVLQTDPKVRPHFETIFSPQSVELVPKQPQKIDVKIRIPEEAAEGIYHSSILVHGFEHIFLSLVLIVTPGFGSVNKISE